MSFLEKGEFTLKSDFEEQLMDQYIEIRIPHARSGLSPLVFSVHLHGDRISEDSFIPHDVTIQHGPVNTLVAHQMEVAINYRNSNFIHPNSDFLIASFFQFNFLEPETYKIPFVTTGGIYDTYPRRVRVGESYQYRAKCIDSYETADWFESVTDEGEMRVFAVGNNIKGSNRIAIPRDLVPFVGSMQDGKFTPPQADLVKAVEFSCYEA